MPKNYQWDPTSARFRDPETGRFIARADVRAVLDRLIVAGQARVTTLSDDLRNGKIDIAMWQEGMRAEIKRSQLASEALLRGGWAQLTPADFGRVGQRVRVQYEYLNGFSQELLAGTQRTDGTFFNRARMYIASARTGFHEELGLLLTTLGYTEERNVLRPAEHCVECIDQSALGWVPIHTLVPIGQRQCLGNDKCDMRYR